MAVTVDDFSGYTTGTGLPTGWTSQGGAASGYEIVTDSGSFGGQAFELTGAAGDGGIRRDLPLTTYPKSLTQFETVTAGDYLQFWFFTGSGIQGYVVELRPFGTSMAVWSNTGGWSQLQTTTVTLTANTKYWMRMDQTTTNIRAKLWAASVAEPGTWNLDVANTAHAGTSMYSGFGNYHTGNTFTVHYFAAGDTEPSVPSSGGIVAAQQLNRLRRG